MSLIVKLCLLSKMLDLKKIDGNQISGASSEDLGFLELLTSQEVDDIFNQHTGLPIGLQLEENITEFPELDEQTLIEINELEEFGKNKSTDDQTKYFVNKFKSFLEEKHLPSIIETMPVKYLSQYLRLWYAKAKKIDGSDFSPATLICMRAAIQRYLTSSSVNRQVDIIDGQDFKMANTTLKASIAVYLKKNSRSDRGTKAIDEEDLRLLSAYFDRSTPERLQHEVFYDFLYYFGYRGREWLRDITRDSVKVCTDGCGREYVDLLTQLHEKNVKASTNRRHYESMKSIVMYSLPESPEKCPVEAVKLYLSKLRSKALFPKPTPKKSTWYSDKQNLGKNTLNDLMKKISFEAELGTVYTNHSIRATVVTELSEKGYSVSDIQNVTGHKRSESVNRYVKRITPTKKQKISHDLTSSLHGQSSLINGDTDNEMSTGSANPRNNNQLQSTTQISDIDIQSNSTKMMSIFRDCNFSNCSFNFSS